MRGGGTTLAAGPELSAPNGLVVDGDHVVMVPFGAASVFRIPAGGGDPEVVAHLPAGQLDGIVRLDDGSFLISSWEGEAVFRLRPDVEVSVVLEGVVAPADIGLDARQGRLLVPLFMDDRVEIHPIG